MSYATLSCSTVLGKGQGVPVFALLCRAQYKQVHAGALHQLSGRACSHVQVTVPALTSLTRQIVTNGSSLTWEDIVVASAPIQLSPAGQRCWSANMLEEDFVINHACSRSLSLIRSLASLLSCYIEMVGSYSYRLLAVSPATLVQIELSKHIRIPSAFTCS